MAKKKIDIFNPGRRIKNSTHANIYPELYKRLCKAAFDLVDEGDYDALQWIWDEIILRRRVAIKDDYINALRRGKFKYLNGLPCAACGKPSDTVDHIIPISKGGNNDLSNLQPMCRKCNLKKLDKV